VKATARAKAKAKLKAREKEKAREKARKGAAGKARPVASGSISTAKAPQPWT
jgi:hypothetical protein